MSGHEEAVYLGLAIKKRPNPAIRGRLARLQWKARIIPAKAMVVVRGECQSFQHSFHPTRFTGPDEPLRIPGLGTVLDDQRVPCSACSTIAGCS